MWSQNIRLLHKRQKTAFILKNGAIKQPSSPPPVQNICSPLSYSCSRKSLNSACIYLNGIFQPVKEWHKHSWVIKKTLLSSPAIITLSKSLATFGWCVYKGAAGCSKYKAVFVKIIISKGHGHELCVKCTTTKTWANVSVATDWSAVCSVNVVTMLMRQCWCAR